MGNKSPFLKVPIMICMNLNLYTEFNSVHYDKDNDILYIVANNGDGAGAYMVCWQIEKGVYKGRKVGIPF